jgi:serine/threonine protein kinase
VNTNLFNKNKNTKSELLDNKTIKLVSKYDVEMLNIVKSTKKHGEGSFGYVTSAEIEFKFKGYRTKKLISAIKVSKDKKVSTYGFSDDMIQECATYARILQSENLAKGLFVKLHKDSQGIVLEHYSINLHYLFKTMALPWNQRDELIRAIFFQVVSGLKELHSLGFIHKDLKPDNILLSHDGRVLIADFGLATYLVNGSDIPQDFYRKITTPVIEPPEGNGAIDALIDKSYDIWSLGCVLAYMIRRKYDFDMWHTKGPSWRQTVTTDDYTEKQVIIFDYFDDNLAKRAPAPSDIFLKSAEELLTGMLSLGSDRRPNVEAILKHEWFDGLTIAKAAAIVRDLVPGDIFGNTGKSKLIANTRKIRNANANDHRNSDAPSYFQIMKQPLVSRFLTTELHSVIKEHLNALLHNMRSMLSFRESLYSYLHALELFNRIVLKNNAFNTKVYLYTCFNIALKNTPDYTFDGLNLDSITDTEDEYILIEAEIMRVLNADTYPQVGGLVDKALTKIGSSGNQLSMALKILNKIFAGSATFDEYIDIKPRDREAVIRFNPIRLLDGFPKVRESIGAASSNGNAEASNGNAEASNNNAGASHERDANSNSRASSGIKPLGRPARMRSK